MASYIMKNVSDNPNCNYYEFECDNEKVLEKINVKNVVMGSTAHVINPDELYCLNSSKEWVQQVNDNSVPKIIKGNIKNDTQKGFICVRMSGKPNARRADYDCDTYEVLKSIDIKEDNASMGSVAHIISDNSYYELNSLGKWEKLKKDSGSGGTSNYNDLLNKPRINDVELNGNLTSEDLKLATKSDLDTTKGDLSNLTSVVLGQGEDIASLDADKLDHVIIPVGGSELTQIEAKGILDNAINYESKFIELATNGDMPNKVVATAHIVNDGFGNTYLLVTDCMGSVKRYNKDTFESFAPISKDLTKQVIDIDTLTIDRQGDPMFTASVFRAFNKPEGTSDKGVVEVVAYNIETQVQVYTDMTNYKRWYRTVMGTDGRHSFGTWSLIGGSGSANEVLTFTGAVNATYDGSKAVTVNIPNGGGGVSDKFLITDTAQNASYICSLRAENGKVFIDYDEKL